MSDKIFPDTNIIVYTFDKAAVEKQEMSNQLLSQFYDFDNYFISGQVVSEFCNIALSKMNPPLPQEKIDNFINTFPESKVLLKDVSIIGNALKLRDKYHYSFWDSLILSSALKMNCNILYSEDSSMAGLSKIH